VLNDNDFGLAGGIGPGGKLEFLDSAPVVLGLLECKGGHVIDASDRDDKINLRNWPAYGMPMPDAIASFTVDGLAYFVSANEGDARDEDDRVGDLDLDPTVFPNASSLQKDEALGRLEVSTIDGDLDGDGDFDQLWSYGARSFSIWDQYGNLVYDSSDDFAFITAKQFPKNFNATNDENDFDSRSDAKATEPEGCTTAVIGKRIYAFIALERMGGVMIYDVTDPTRPEFQSYVNNRNFAGDPEKDTAKDLAPETLIFVPAKRNGTKHDLLIVANEVSGSTTAYRVVRKPVNWKGK
jgi:hypothetical protein